MPNKITARFPRIKWHGQGDEVMVTSSDTKTQANLQLVLRIQAGDHRAETELIEKYSRAVGFEARKQGKGAPYADDIFQETFCIALEKIRDGKLEEPQKLASFLMGIAQNTAKEFRRKEIKHHPFNYQPSKEIPKAPGNPLIDLMKQEKAEIIRLYIRELKPPRDREILSRFFLLDEDKDSICRDLGITREHFSRVIHRAKKRFEKLLLKKKNLKSYLF